MSRKDTVQYTSSLKAYISKHQTPLPYWYPNKISCSHYSQSLLFTMPATGFKQHDTVRIMSRCSNHYKELGIVVGFTKEKVIVRLPSGDIPYWPKSIELASKLRNKATDDGDDDRVRYMVNTVTRQNPPSGRNRKPSRTVFKLQDQVEITTPGKNYLRVGTIVLFLPNNKVMVKFPSSERHGTGCELPFFLKSIEHRPVITSDCSDSLLEYFEEWRYSRSWSVSINSHNWIG